MKENCLKNYFNGPKKYKYKLVVKSKLNMFLNCLKTKMHEH